MQQLKKTLALKDVISLTLCSIVGSGLLALPGLAYETAGADALLAWMFMVILVIPLVIIFGDLSVRYPSAGGIVGFTGMAFGSGLARSMAFLMAGTFPVGRSGWPWASSLCSYAWFLWPYSAMLLYMH